GEVAPVDAAQLQPERPTVGRIEEPAHRYASLGNPATCTFAGPSANSSSTLTDPASRRKRHQAPGGASRHWPTMLRMDTACATTAIVRPVWVASRSAISAPVRTPTS